MQAKTQQLEVSSLIQCVIVCGTI